MEQFSNLIQSEQINIPINEFLNMNNLNEIFKGILLIGDKLKETCLMLPNERNIPLIDLKNNLNYINEHNLYEESIYYNMSLEFYQNSLSLKLNLITFMKDTLAESPININTRTLNSCFKFLLLPISIDYQISNDTIDLDITYLMNLLNNCERIFNQKLQEGSSILQKNSELFEREFFNAKCKEEYTHTKVYSMLSEINSGRSKAWNTLPVKFRESLD
jgi:hypothetical protein